MDETSIQRFRFYMTKLRHTESIPMPLVACGRFFGWWEIPTSELL